MRAGLALLVALAGLPALAHNRPDQRSVLVQLSPTQVELVVHWKMKDGVEAAEVRRRVDGNGDRRLTLKVEKLGQAQLLMPRLQRGLSVWVGKRQLSFTVAEVAFKDAQWVGPRTGFEALVLFRAAADLSGPSHTLTVAVTDGPPIEVMAQGAGLTLRGEGLPNRPGDPVVGPATISAQGQSEVRVRVQPLRSGGVKPGPN